MRECASSSFWVQTLGDRRRIPQGCCQHVFLVARPGAPFVASELCGAHALAENFCSFCSRSLTISAARFLVLAGTAFWPNAEPLCALLKWRHKKESMREGQVEVTLSYQKMWVPFVAT